MAIRLGLEAKLYYDPAGVGVGTWTELTNVKDLTLNLETAEADVTTRGNNGWRATVATLRDGSIEFEMVWDTGDAGFAAIKDAYFNKTPIGFAVMDGGIAVAGSEGLHANMAIINFTRTENLEEAIMVQVSCKPTYSTVAPAWVVTP